MSSDFVFDSRKQSNDIESWLDGKLSSEDLKKIVEHTGYGIK